MASLNEEQIYDDLFRKHAEMKCCWKEDNGQNSEDHGIQKAEFKDSQGNHQGGEAGKEASSEEMLHDDSSKISGENRND